jgi:hypothetical protein
MNAQRSMHVYQVRPRSDKRGFGFIADALPFGRLWYGAQTQPAVQSPTQSFSAAHMML